METLSNNLIIRKFISIEVENIYFRGYKRWLK